MLQPTPEEDEQDDEDGDVDDVSESDNDELDTDMIDERDSADDVILCNSLSISARCHCPRDVKHSLLLPPPLRTCSQYSVKMRIVDKNLVAHFFMACVGPPASCKIICSFECNVC